MDFHRILHHRDWELEEVAQKCESRISSNVMLETLALEANCQMEANRRWRNQSGLQWDFRFSSHTMFSPVKCLVYEAISKEDSS
jgi:hypothetical protein